MLKNLIRLLFFHRKAFSNITIITRIVLHPDKERSFLMKSMKVEFQSHLELGVI